jgi:hypothetical protein
MMAQSTSRACELGQVLDGDVDVELAGNEDASASCSFLTLETLSPAPYLRLIVLRSLSPVPSTTLLLILFLNLCGRALSLCPLHFFPCA